jgi:hypothetical protein
MPEHENAVFPRCDDHVVDPGCSRRDPVGALREATGRVRVPLDRPDPDLASGAAPDQSDCEGDQAGEARTARGAGTRGPEGWGWARGEADEAAWQEARDARHSSPLSPTQIIALEAVSGLTVALSRAPFCAELVEGAARVGAAALGAADSDDDATRALRHLRRLAFAHRLVERLIEQTCLRVIRDGKVPSHLEGEARAFAAAFAPAEGTAGAKVALQGIHRWTPLAAWLADDAALQIALAAGVAPAPSAEAVLGLADEPELRPAAAIHWLLRGDAHLGLLDVVIDLLPDILGVGDQRGLVSQEARRTLRSAIPGLLARAPAIAELLLGQPLDRALLYGEAATEVLLRLALDQAVRERPAGQGPDSATDRA